MIPTPPSPSRRSRPTTAPPGAAAALLLAAPAALLLATSAAPAPAQVAPPAGETPDGRLEVTAIAGVLAPLTRLTTDPETFETEVSSAALLGAEATWWRTSRFGASAQVAWAPAQLSLVPTDFTGALPSDLGDADYLAGSVEVRYSLPVPPEVRLVRPYLALGGGIRRLEVEPIASPEVEDAVDPMATVAGGARVPLWGRISLRFELRDRVTIYGSPAGAGDRTQHDLGITVGVGTRVR